MARWTDWAPLHHPDGTNLTPSEIPYEGPGAYILAVRRGRGKERTLYVGHSSDLNQRLYNHSYGDTSTWEALEKLAGKGFRVLYSVHPTKTSW